MRTWTLAAYLWLGAVVAEEPPALLTERLERVERVTAQAQARHGELAEANQRALERLTEEGTRRPDPALRLWAERERRVHETTPFCNLSRPERVTGYPEDLQRLSASLRAELTAFLDVLKGQREALIREAEAAFDARVRTLVRADEIEGAEREKNAFEGFEARKAVKELDREIQRMGDLLSGKRHRGLWRRPKDDQIPAPPDALFLFDADCPTAPSWCCSRTTTPPGAFPARRRAPCSGSAPPKASPTCPTGAPTCGSASKACAPEERLRSRIQSWWLSPGEESAE